MAEEANEECRLHTLPAQQLHLSHLAPSLSQYSQSLKERQDAVQEENVEILSRVVQQRKDISSLVSGLEGVFADLEASVATLQRDDGDAEALRAEVRVADDETRMSD